MTNFRLPYRLAIGFVFASAAIIVLCVSDHVSTQTTSPEARSVPARTIPVPTTVSPQMQALAGAPPAGNWNTSPATVEEWKTLSAPSAGRNLPALRDRLGVKTEAMTVNGVNAFMVTPQVLPPENRNRLLVHMHGGCYVLSGGEAADERSDLHGRLRPFPGVVGRLSPAARGALPSGPGRWHGGVEVGVEEHGSEEHSDLRNIRRRRADAVDGSSREAGRTPLPGAIAPGTPMSDLTGTGDLFATNLMVDNVLVGSDGRCDAMAELYANGHDLKDPLLSPVYGDMHEFPPTILTTGTRDLLLSNTVRVHRKLRQAGIEAELHVYEGQSHAQYMRDVNAPETKEAFEEIAKFFDRHLGK